MSTLTKRQKQILEFIIKYIDSNGFPPSTSEIQKRFSFKSPNAVQDHLAALEKKGYISRHPHKSRGIEVLIHTAPRKNSDNIMRIPIVGRVSAGTPIFAQENIEGTLPIDKSFAKSADGIFALKVEGTSMVNAGILDGDYVIVRQQQNAEQGDIIVALIEDETTVKRFYKDKGSRKIILQPENDAMDPISIESSSYDKFMIVGKVKGVIRQRIG